MSTHFVGGLIVPTLPHPLLCPEANPGYAAIREAYAAARERIDALDADLLVLYSTRWPSVIGHQIQAEPSPTWTHVDEDFHALGSIPYTLNIDAAFAERYRSAAQARQLTCRTVAYQGFPIDTGSVVALKLLDPSGTLPATITSCNMYADRTETLILGKAAADAVASTGRRAVAVAVTNLSNRMFPHPIDPSEDRIFSPTHEEWNRKLLEFLQAGRLEDVSQLAREFSRQAHGDNRLKAIWWLAAAMGQTNAYRGEVLAYAPIHGAGCTLTWLRRADRAAPGLEFDEDDVDVYRGDRNVLEREGAAPADPSVADAIGTPPASVGTPARGGLSAVDPARAAAPRSSTATPLRGERIFDISPTLSERIAVWPGDVAYSRAETASLAKGDTIDLSSLTTTLHVGAHTDAPSHYELGGQDIASRELDRYLGTCQVVHVQVGRGERILPEHVEVEITAPRVLFRTQTFPDPDTWNADFASLSPELVGWLHERGVHLVGIDTPSIDPAESKALESHSAVAARDMAVLEGIVLRDVPQGSYTLVALPLKIEGGDASPVRAALVG